MSHSFVILFVHYYTDKPFGEFHSYTEKLLFMVLAYFINSSLRYCHHQIWIMFYQRHDHTSARVLTYSAYSLVTQIEVTDLELCIHKCQDKFRQG